MVTKFSVGRTLAIASLASLVWLEVAIPSQSAFASPSSESSTLLVPNRRKPGGNRQLVEVPGRRKPGGTRQFAEVPGRRKPGGTRQFAEVPGRRKPGSARVDLALLLEKQLFSSSSGHCQAEAREITALIPENLQGLTASVAPTIYFVIPKMSSVPDLEFVLQDGQQRVIYAAKVTNSSSGGIMSLKVPQSHALEANQTYHWYLSAVCDADNRERDLVVEGLIQRGEGNPSVVSMSPEEKIRFYQQNNLWYDSLDAVIDLHQKQGNSPYIQETWQSLLKSVDLSEFDSFLQEKTFFTPNIQSLSLTEPKDQSSSF